MKLSKLTKQALTCLFAFGASLSAAYAQDATYHLPKTAVKISMLVEKTDYTPGTLCEYSRRFLKKMDVISEQYVEYRMLDVEMFPIGIPDTAKVFAARVDQKHNIQKLAMTEDNILLAINAEKIPYTTGKTFTPAKKPAKLDPFKYLNQDILATGSKMKMAELCAKEIYDIRDSKNELTRGQADYMPKDGEQLRIMFSNLDTQEAAIRQLFEGVTTRDTMVVDFVYVPTKEVNDDVAFRFSKYSGLVNADNLSGEPYYVTVKDLHTKPERITEQGKKAPKDETGVWICLPGKIKVSLATAEGEVAAIDFGAAQFGEIENLNEPLFGKKVNTSIVLNPYNGGIDKIESVPVK